MPDMETADDGVVEDFANELRAAVGRLQDDAAIAVELNPESLALDDVHLLRDVIVAYAERIMAFESLVKDIIATVRDDAAWSAARSDTTRGQLAEKIEQWLQDPGRDIEFCKDGE